MLRRRRRVVTLIGAGLLLALVAAGCASDYHYVKSSEDRTYFRVPKRWTLFDEKAIMDRLGTDLTEAQRATELEQTWRVAFDAAPNPSLEHLAGTVDHPSGIALVRRLSFDMADSISLNALRNYFFDIDSALQNDQGTLTSYDELQLDGGFRGIHLVADLEVGARGTITIDQTTLVDQATTKVYALLISCSSRCFERNRGEIEKVVESWTVRAK